jgi:hypothetical protein
MSSTDRSLGFAFSYGVFQDYYLSSDEFRNSGNIAAIGTCALVIDMAMDPVISYVY